MIWSFGWGSAWSRWPFASTELSTLAFRDLLWCSPKGTLLAPRRDWGVRRVGHDWTRRQYEAARRGKLDFEAKELVALRIEFAGPRVSHPCSSTPSALSQRLERTRHGTRCPGRSPIGGCYARPNNRHAPFGCDDNRVRRMGTREFVQRTESRRSHTWHRFPQQTKLFPVTRILGQNEISMI